MKRKVSDKIKIKSSVTIFHFQNGSEISVSTMEVGINDYGFYFEQRHGHSNNKAHPILNIIALKDIKFIEVRTIFNQNKRTYTIEEYINILFKRPNIMIIKPEALRHEEMVYYE